MKKENIRREMEPAPEKDKAEEKEKEKTISKGFLRKKRSIV